MEPILKGFYDLLEDMHADCREAFAGLGTDELDWVPGEEMNSMAVLAAHIAGSATFWIGDIVMQEPTGRDRPAEFVTEGMDEGALTQLLDRSLARVAGAFESLSLAQLAETRSSPFSDREFTVAWAIAHILQHTALHLGHMQVTRQLLELPVDED